MSSSSLAFHRRAPDLAQKAVKRDRVLLLALVADKHGRLRVFATDKAVHVFYGLAARALELSWRQSSVDLFAAAIMFLLLQLKTFIHSRKWMT
jgi:hypothetical protein